MIVRGSPTEQAGTQSRTPEISDTGASTLGVPTLADLVERAGLNVEWDRRANPDICGITDDSRRIKPGACFVAVRGTQVDGHRYVPSAIEGGAAAVVVEEVTAVSPPPLDNGVAVLRVPDSRIALGRLAAVWHGLDELQDAGRLRVIGVTGTNGKSTTCFLLRAILQAAGHPTALLGTIEYDLLARRLDAPMTTPPVTRSIEYLVEAARAGARFGVMEVSSHALDQRRTAGIGFDAAVFTNLTGDHLDYHRDLDAYRTAKKRLFDGLDAHARAVVNSDDPSADAMLADSSARVIRYGNEPHADVHAVVEEMDATGSRIRLICPDAMADVNLRLIGHHNVQNALAAAAAAWALSVDIRAIHDGLESVELVRGRLERVRVEGVPIHVLVDYAHTDDALRNVLRAVQPLTCGRLIVLFGCGGDRDRGKRPRMAATVAEFADRIIVTSDNPRTESPEQIIDEVLTGFTPQQRSQVVVEVDRREAIRKAIDSAQPGDLVLLAGKGHETYQIIGGHRIHFDDVQEAAAAMRSWSARRPEEADRR